MIYAALQTQRLPTQPSNRPFNLAALCAVSLALGLMAGRTYASDATFTPSGPTLNLSLQTSGMSVHIASQGASYTFVLPAGKTWSGSNNSNVTGSGLNSLTVTNTGIQSFSGGITLTDSGNSESIVFDDSTANSYSNSLTITVANPGDSIVFNGSTTLSGSNFLSASAANTLTLSPSAILTGGASGFIKLQAAGMLLVDTNAVVSGGPSLTLEADTKANGTGDDGVGTLVLNGNTLLLGIAISLRGADIDIAATGTVGDNKTSTIVIHTSLPTQNISLGGANNAGPGVNLTDVELSRLFVMPTGVIQFGDTNLAGNIVFLTAKPGGTPGANIVVQQNTSAPGRIALDTGGNALDGNGGRVSLAPGSGGIQVGQNINDIPLTTNGFSANGLPLVFTINAAPMLGDQITIIRNTSVSPIVGTFNAVSQGSNVVAAFNGSSYQFTVDYMGGAGQDLVFTCTAIPPTAITDASGNYTAHTAFITGAVNANGASTNVSFDYGTTAAYGFNVAAVPGTATGTSVNPVAQTLSGLAPNTMYHYRLKASSTYGTQFGADMTFTTSTLSNADLLKLYCNNGSIVISPFVDPNTLNYSATTAPSTTTITLNAFLSDIADSLKINAVAGSSGIQSNNITLVPGPNTIPIDITAEDGSTKKTYTIVVTKSSTPVPSMIFADPASTVFDSLPQTVTLSANVASNSGSVNGGTGTFQLMNGNTPIGNPVTAGLSEGITANYTIPGGTPGGTYTIVVTYSGNADYAPSTDNTQFLTITSAPTAVGSSSVSGPYSSANQNVPISASVVSGAGTVNGGTVTFQIVNTLNQSPIGSPAISGPVANGTANATLVLPGGTTVGTYSINATYSGSPSFSTSTDSKASLTVNSTASQTTLGPAQTAFNANAHVMTLTAQVLSIGPVNEGIVTFTVFNPDGSPIGSPILSLPVVNGSISVSFTVPAGLALGSYAALASYNGGTNLKTSSDTTHTVDVLAVQSAQIDSPLAEAGVVGVPFSYQITATNSPTSFNAIPLPQGLSIDTKSGIISGTPKSVGNFNIAISATNLAGTDTQPLVLSVTPNQAPVIPELISDDDPGQINLPVTYQITATDVDTPILSYTLDFGDGSPALSGQFEEGTVVSLSHTYTNYFPVGVTVTLTVTDGFTAVTQTALQNIPMPSSSGDGITNTLQDELPIVEPLDGLSVKVASSNGGIIQLAIDVNSLTRSAYSLTTIWGDVSGRSSKVSGDHPLHDFASHGIFVATTSATNKISATQAGKVRVTLPISSKETGDFPPHVHIETMGIRSAPNNVSTITTTSLKGKFDFSGKKPDLVTFTGNITMPAGLTVGQPHDFWIAIGNIVVQTTIDKNGKGSTPGTPAVLKSLKIASKLKKGTVTTGTEPATVTVTYSTQDMVNQGFDTEGVSTRSTDASNGKTGKRMVQVAMLLDGTPFQSLSPVDFSLSKDSLFGTISGRSKK